MQAGYKRDVCHPGRGVEEGDLAEADMPGWHLDGVIPSDLNELC